MMAFKLGRSGGDKEKEEEGRSDRAKGAAAAVDPKEPTEEDAGAAQRTGGSVMKKILLIVGVLVLVAGSAAGGLFFLKGKHSPKKTATAPATVEQEIKTDASGEESGHGEKADKTSGEAGAKEGDSKEGSAKEAGAKDASHTDLTCELEKFTTNLSDDLSTYVQMKVELEAATPEGKKLIEQNMAPLRDATIMLLSSKTRADVQSLTGKERLKRELLTRYQGVLNSNKQPRNLYITEFTVVRY
jgi:flagellar FliL protein